MANKFYAVKQGRTPGVYSSWAECEAQVKGYPGAVYKSFLTADQALVFVTGIEPHGAGKQNRTPEKTSRTGAESRIRELTAYVDGSYHSGTKEFSYGAVFLTPQGEVTVSEKLSDPSLAAMHNVAGEIKGAEAAMRYAAEQGYSKLTIYHDYEGIAKWCTGEWRANKPGTQAYKAYYDSLCSRLAVSFVKVKGHSGDRYNDMADRLAKEALGIKS